jgi:DNA replication protein DnaC
MMKIETTTRPKTHLFFQFITARYMKGSTIITSNRSVRDWVHIFAEDQMATTAIIDRLFHRSQIINIEGRSYRLNNFDLIAQDKDKKR